MSEIRGEEKNNNTLEKIEKEPDKSASSKKKIRKKISTHQKKILLLTSIITTTVLLIAIVLFITFSKISITISDELNIVLSPLQQSTHAINLETTQIKFTIKNNNFFQCNALCNFTLVDQSTNKKIYTSAEKLSHAQKIEKSFDVTAPIKGSGQIIYSFEARCHNINSIICLTDETQKFANAVASLNYEISEEDQSAKILFKPKIEALLNEIATTTANMNTIPQETIPARTIEGAKLLNLIIDQKQKLKEINLNAERLLQLWQQEEYSSVKKTFNESHSTYLQENQKTFSKIKTDFEQLIAARNSNINLLMTIPALTEEIIELQTFYSTEKNPNNYAKLSTAINACESLQDGYLQITKNITHSETDLAIALPTSLNTLTESVDKYKKINAKLILLNMHSQNILILKNKTLSNTTLDCRGLKNLNEKIDLINQEAEARLKEEQNKSNETIILDFSNATKYLSSEALKNTILEVQNSTLKNKKRILDLASNMSSVQYQTKPNEEEIKNAPINNSANLDFLSENCDLPNAAESPNSQTISRLLSINFNQLETLKINATISAAKPVEPIVLKDTPSECCALGECTPCCEEESCADENYPVLFIHGHSFNNKNTPDYSLDSFNEMQQKMQDDGYINLGQLEIENNPQNTTLGTWGKAKKPIAVKASYYYISHYNLGDYDVSVQNKEGLENYAIRLKEIISLVQEQTGKNKINLVAHSMGGLVARDYIQLFGSEKINKLILINTPNHGVEGRTKEWCTLLGSSKECEEMIENSIFLSRLNAKPTPQNIDIYAIRSTGCKMDGGASGDGVVTNKSAYLDGAKNIELKGNCTDSLNSNLHNDILNPRQYPEAYRTILEILKK